MIAEGKRQDLTRVGAALKGTMGPLMRQVRKFSALRSCVKALPAELEGLAAPFDVKLARSNEPGAEGGVADQTVLYMYVASPTVQLIVEKQKGPLMRKINGELPYPLVEDLRFEHAPAAKIQRQLNILALTPD